MPSIKLGKRVIDNYSRPYIIAEIGVNHEGSVETAKKLAELKEMTLPKNLILLIIVLHVTLS